MNKETLQQIPHKYKGLQDTMNNYVPTNWTRKNVNGIWKTRYSHVKE